MTTESRKKIYTLQDVLHFLSRYIKYWKLGVLGALLGMILALSYFVYGKPSYYSKCLVEYSFLDLPIKSEVSDLSAGPAKYENIFNKLFWGLQSRWLVERTAQRLGLVKGVTEFESVWHNYFSKIRVTPSVAGHLAIEVWVYEPWLAKVWPQAMLAEYHDYLVESRVKHRETLVAGYGKEMDRIKKNLDAEVQKDRDFESDNQILETYIANNKLEQVPSQMLTLRAQLDRLVEMQEYIEKSALTSGEKLALLQKNRAAPLQTGTIVRRNESPDPFVSISKSETLGAVPSAIGESPGPSILGGASTRSVVIMPEHTARKEAWQQIDDELKSATREYDRLSATLLPGHEKMRELRKRLDFLTYSLDLEWTKAITALQLEKSNLTQRIEDLQKQMPEYRKLVNGYDSYKREFRLQNSGRLAWETAYVGMKARLTAMEYTGEEVRVNFNIVGFNEVQDEIPVSPNKKKLLTYAVALSVGLGLGGPILVERLRFTSSFIAEAEKYCQLAPCGVVPYMARNQLSLHVEVGNEVRSISQVGNHLVESFRMIRTRIPIVAQPDNRNQILMITSSRPADGKSTVAAHLAKSFAEAGEKTLLIDGDLKRGSLHRIFNLNGNSKGLMECLANDIPATELIQVTDYSHLNLLPRGYNVKLNRELLSGAKFRDLIEGLRGSYDKIIIDSPPLLGLADSILISGSVDGILFVIRSDQTTQRDIVSASEILTRAKAPVYGFVLNAVDFNRAENYYYYGYYNSQYYESTYYQPEPA